jgi:predicted pore-forming effector associated with SMODS systems
MGSGIRVRVIVAVVIVVFALGIWTSGGTFQAGWLRFYSAAVAIVLGVLALWEYWVWGWSWVQLIPGVPRDIRGTWKGELETSWKDEHGVSPPRKTAYLVVRQSASRVSAVLLTDESRSTSSLATVSSDGATVSLDYMYLNWPDVGVEERSRIHHGSASLVVSGAPASRLRGRYWTSRDTRGELDFTSRVSRLTEDYDEADRAFSGG